MGVINCCSTRDRPDTFSLPNMATNERKIIHYLFSNLSTENLKFRHLGDHLCKIFKKTPNFGKKLLRFFKYLSPDMMDFELFKFHVQLFVRQPLERPEAPYPDYNILEIFSLVSMMKFGVPNLDAKSLVSYSEAKEFFLDLTSLIVDGSVQEQFQSGVIKAFLSPLFSRDTIRQEFLDWEVFMGYIGSQMRYLHDFLRWIFCYKLLVQETCFFIPRLEKNSIFTEINNPTAISFLMMSNIYVNLTPLIKMVYSSVLDGFSFDKFAKKITDYDGPTYILVRNEKGDIFGGFKPDKWEKNQDSQGTSECYLFSLWPRFRNFFPVENQVTDPRNSAYLNDVKHVGQRGLGFGFDEKTNLCRFWIDEDMVNKSYVSLEDSMFEEGYLCDPSSDGIKIQDIEVWGLEKSNSGFAEETLATMNRKIVKDLNNKMADFLKTNKGISFGSKENYNLDQEESLGFRQKSVIKKNSEDPREEKLKRNAQNTNFPQTSPYSPNTVYFKNPREKQEHFFNPNPLIQEEAESFELPPPKTENQNGRFLNYAEKRPENIKVPKLEKSGQTDSKLLSVSQNLEYPIHSDNKSDFGGEVQEKKSYVSIKPEPKVADSNLSSPDEDKRKKGAKLLRPEENYERVMYNESKLDVKRTEKKIFEDDRHNEFPRNDKKPYGRKSELASPSKDFRVAESFYKEKNTFQNPKRSVTPNSRDLNDDYLRKTYNYYGQYKEPARPNKI